MAHPDFTTITPENVIEETLFCSKDVKNTGFKAKQEWFEEYHPKGLQLKLLKNKQGNSIAFIEYLPAEIAWRPVQAPNYQFIHCMFVLSKKDRDLGNGSELVQHAIEDAKKQGKAGVAVMTSDGPWMANKMLFERNGFKQVDQRGRFELLVYKIKSTAPDPKLLDWTKQQTKYKGWNLIYADQCPWHQKAMEALTEVATEHKIQLIVKRLKTPTEAQQAPSGFGVFSLLHDGELLEDHYISATRFKNILKKELSAAN